MDVETLWGRVRGNYYKTRKEWPDSKDPAYDRKRHEYGKDNARLEAEFKKDLLDAYRVTKHPKAEVAYRIAWDKGHSSGYSEVVNEFDDLVELLKD